MFSGKFPQLGVRFFAATCSLGRDKGPQRHYPPLARRPTHGGSYSTGDPLTPRAGYAARAGENRHESPVVQSRSTHRYGSRFFVSKAPPILPKLSYRCMHQLLTEQGESGTIPACHWTPKADFLISVYYRQQISLYSLEST